MAGHVHEGAAKLVLNQLPKGSEPRRKHPTHVALGLHFTDLFNASFLAKDDTRPSHKGTCRLGLPAVPAYTSCVHARLVHCSTAQLHKGCNCEALWDKYL